MFYTVYKITNLVNGKIYVGAHKTKDLNDEYMGSGNLIKKAIEKYGIENFKKEYISIFDNAEDMFKMESELVNEEFINREDTYNLKQGGSGGFDFINKNNLGGRKDEFNNNIGFVENFENIIKNFGCVQSYLKFKNDGSYEKFCENLSKSQNIRFANGAINGFLGKTHTEETKKRIGEANSKHQLGEGNSQFGTIWIHNIELKENKKIKKDDFSSWEQDGWIKGRKMPK